MEETTLPPPKIYTRAACSSPSVCLSVQKLFLNGNSWDHHISVYGSRVLSERSSELLAVRVSMAPLLVSFYKHTDLEGRA